MTLAELDPPRPGEAAAIGAAFIVCNGPPRRGLGDQYVILHDNLAKHYTHDYADALAWARDHCAMPHSMPEIIDAAEIPDRMNSQPDNHTRDVPGKVKVITRRRGWGRWR